MPEEFKLHILCHVGEKFYVNLCVEDTRNQHEHLLEFTYVEDFIEIKINAVVVVTVVEDVEIFKNLCDAYDHVGADGDFVLFGENREKFEKHLSSCLIGQRGLFGPCAAQTTFPLLNDTEMSKDILVDELVNLTLNVTIMFHSGPDETGLITFTIDDDQVDICGVTEGYVLSGTSYLHDFEEACQDHNLREFVQDHLVITPM